VIQRLSVYLLSKSETAWKIEVLQTLEEITSRLKDLINTDQVCAVLHIGFDRCKTVELEQLYERFPMFIGTVFLTQETALILRSFGVRETQTKLEIGGRTLCVLNQVMDTESIRFKSSQLKLTNYLSIASDVGHRIPSGTPPATKSRREGLVSSNWIRELNVEQSPLAVFFQDNAILSDEDYLDRERYLSEDMRYRLAKARGEFLFESKPSVSVSELVSFLPEWEANRDIQMLGLSQRTQNALLRNNIQQLEALYGVSDERLMRFSGFGQRCLLELRDYLTATLRDPKGLIQPQLDLASPLVQPQPDSVKRPGTLSETREPFNTTTSLLDGIVSRMSIFSDVYRQVLCARTGYMRPQLTLQEISEILQLTRERIRQIESKVLMQLGDVEITSVIVDRIDVVRKAIVSPLTITLLERLDPWFVGISQNKEVFHFFLERSRTYSLQELSKIEFIAPYTSSSFKKVLHLLESIVQQEAAKGIEKRELLTKVQKYATEAPELVDLFFREVTDHLIWSSSGPDNEVRLLSVGRSAEAYVRAALEESERPLLIADIQNHVLGAYGKSLDLRRVHNACMNVALLYGRRLYGLRKHLGIEDSRVEQIKEQVLDFFEDIPLDRQVRVSEIMESVDLDAAKDVIDDYRLSIICEEMQQIESLNRMIFIKVDPSSPERKTRRIEIHESVEAILRASDRPLRSDEIRELISKQRGISSFFQIFQKGNVIRVAPNTWALNDKHLGLSASVEQEILAVCERFVVNAGSGGISAEEFCRKLKAEGGFRKLPDSPYILMSLALKTGKIIKEEDRLLAKDVISGEFA